MNAGFDCQGLFKHDRQRGNVGALCLVPLLPEASPSLGSGAEEEDVAHCINKLSSVRLLMLVCDVACMCHQLYHGLSLPRWCSVMLSAHQCLHGQNTVPL